MIHARRCAGHGGARWTPRVVRNHHCGLPPEAAGHAVREYLAVLNDAAFGAATPVTPKFISSADPASRWTGANGGLAYFAYSDNT